MFRSMRRKRQLIPNEESIEIIKNGKSGVLAVLGDDDYPYTVPLNYVYADSKIYFHWAKAGGHKLDAVKKHNKVSFCIVEQEDILPEKYTTIYKSVVVFGKINILETDEEKRNAIEHLSIKYNPNDSKENRDVAIEKDYIPLLMVELEIEHISGKESIELTNKR